MDTNEIDRLDSGCQLQCATGVTDSETRTTMLIEHSTTGTDQRECPDCGARPAVRHLQHADTCPVLRDTNCQADADRDHGPRIRPATFAERQHLQMLGIPRAVARAVRVHVTDGARLFVYKGRTIAVVRELGGAA